jgi:hypothetical protein
MEQVTHHPWTTEAQKDMRDIRPTPATKQSDLPVGYRELARKEQVILRSKPTISASKDSARGMLPTNGITIHSTVEKTLFQEETNTRCSRSRKWPLEN